MWKLKSHNCNWLQKIQLAGVDRKVGNKDIKSGQSGHCFKKCKQKVVIVVGHIMKTEIVTMITKDKAYQSNLLQVKEWSLQK